MPRKFWEQWLMAVCKEISCHSLLFWASGGRCLLRTLMSCHLTLPHVIGVLLYYIQGN